MKTAVFSVVYPAAKPFLKDFLGSVAAQTDKRFELVLVNDGVSGLDRLLKPFPVKTHILRGTGGPGTLRKQGIRRAARLGFDSIVFADADDRMASNRVEVCKELIKKNDLVFNELLVFGRGIKTPQALIGKRFREGSRLRKKDLLDMNCLGLSNTTARMNVIKPAAESAPDKVCAYDWSLFSHALHRAKSAVFTKRTWTLYRQHAVNITPLHFGNEKNVLRAAEIKAEHYSAMRSLGRPYGELSSRFSGLLRQLKSDRVFRKDYCRAVRQMTPVDALWWEPVKSIEEIRA